MNLLEEKKRQHLIFDDIKNRSNILFNKEHEYVLPLQQLLLICKMLSNNNMQIENSIYVVGGQAVAYWFSRYSNNHVLPKELVSNDLDFCARSSELNNLSNILNVNITKNTGLPPSLGIFQLINKDTGEFFTHEGKYFLEPFDFEINGKQTPTLVDIIDCPNGFDLLDFHNNKSWLYTDEIESVYTDLDFEKNAKIRILNPIATLESRLANLKDARKLGKKQKNEIERINALLYPVSQYILTKFKEKPYKESKIYLAYLKDVLFKYRKLNQQYDLSFENCFYSITGYLQNNAHEFENIPELFINKGLFFMNKQFNEQVLLENKKVKKPSF